MVAVEEELIHKIDKLEQEVERGIPTLAGREEALADLERIVSLTSRFRNWRERTNPLGKYRERAKALAARIEQF